jgi:hypothetical protein
VVEGGSVTSTPEPKVPTSKAQAENKPLTQNYFNFMGYYDPRTFFEEELLKLEAIFDQSQVIVTHVGPDASSMPTKYQNNPLSTFFYFDSSSFLERAKGKVWCYGHTHIHADYHHSNGCRLINNVLGYSNEKTGATIRIIEI